MRAIDSVPKCVNCAHARVPQKFPWYFWLIPPYWLVFAIGKTLDAWAPWCTVGDVLVGVKPANGCQCRKMRTFGACGPSGSLFQAKEEQ